MDRRQFYFLLGPLFAFGNPGVLTFWITNLSDLQAEFTSNLITSMVVEFQYMF